MLDSLKAEAVEAYLQRTDLPDDVRQVLEIRQLSGSASVKKIYAIENQTSDDDRLRNMVTHHGARTGRPTGEGAQPLNLPKAGPQLATCGGCAKPYAPKHDLCPWCFAPAHPAPRLSWKPEMIDHVLEIMATQSHDAVDYFFGDPLLCISGCVRGLFIAGPGRVLIASDYSAIEAVVAACLAGEQWRIDAFRELKDIYLQGASRITGISYEQYLAYAAEHGESHPDRQYLGKTSELSCTYGGWTGAWRAFDKSGIPRSDDELADIIKKWRAASPRIEAMWGGQKVNWQPELYGIEGAVIEAIQTPGRLTVPRLPSTMWGQPEFPVRVEFQVRPFGTIGRNALFMRLPSGRELTYHDPQLRQSEKRPGTLAISYQTWNTNQKYGAKGWVKMDTWGSRVFENLDQAVAHDIQRHGIELCRAAGYDMVLGVYDEDVFEVPEGFGSVEEVERLMGTMPPWAAGWPIRAAGGWAGRRYRKG